MSDQSGERPPIAKMDDFSVAVFAAMVTYGYAMGERAAMPNEAGALVALKAQMDRTKAESGIPWSKETANKLRRAVKLVSRRIGLVTLSSMN